MENEEEDNAKIATAKRKLEVELDRASAQIGEMQQEVKNVNIVRKQTNLINYVVVVVVVYCLLSQLDEEKVLREQDLEEMVGEIDQLRDQINRTQKDKKNIEDNYYVSSRINLEINFVETYTDNTCDILIFTPLWIYSYDILMFFHTFIYIYPCLGV